METTNPVQENPLRNVQQDVKARYQSVKERGTEVLENAKDKGNQFIEDSADYVRNNPGRSIGIAVLSGLVLGVAGAVLLNRRGDSSSSFDSFKASVGKKANSGWDALKDQIDCGLSTLQDKIQDIQKAIR